MARIALVGADIHDGTTLHHDRALILDGRRVIGIAAPSDIPAGCEKRRLPGGVLAPGFIDLQVNGGGGVMFNDDQSVAALATIARAHAGVGTAALLPTLITDTPNRTRAAVAAVRAAVEQGVPGIIGIHLEGPHLSRARKGAHDPSLIRPMDDDDLHLVIAAAAQLPNVMLTAAPENITVDQIAALSAAGVIVSLGHSDAGFDACRAAVDGGAVCATHLFNAMSQLGNREPGLVGTVLDDGRLSAGLIADGIHVHPACIRAALRAKEGPGRIFLVTDAMSTVGSDITEFMLNGRRILRRDGRLTLADGTLAGADLDMPGALRVMTSEVGIDTAEAIAMATSVPAGVLRSDLGFGRLTVGQTAHAVYLDDKLTTARPVADL